jgi:hypothetical protein
MKRHLPYLMLTAVLLLFGSLAHGQTTIIEWDFNSNAVSTAGISGNSASISCLSCGTMDFISDCSDDFAECEDIDDNEFWVTSSFKTTGYKNIKYSFRQRSKTDGPKEFKFQYRLSTSGTWTDATSTYTTPRSTGCTSYNPSNASFSSTLDDQAIVQLRWLCITGETGLLSSTSGGYLGSVKITGTAICPSTTSTLNVTGCGVYAAPSGKLYTSSGTYTDTIPNDAGCDSIITINLTMTSFYEKVSQVGSDILGGGTNYSLGEGVAFNGDGSIVAVGGSYYDNWKGIVQVYQNVGGTWTQLGSNIVGEDINNWSGRSISLSNDGTILAVGAAGNTGVNGAFSGHVRVYKYSSGSWSQLGSDIDGEAASDFSGQSVSLSSDGSRVAIGAYGNTSSSGHIRVYEYSGGSWSQLGSDIDGSAGSNFGNSVSISADGNRVAGGAPYHSGLTGYTAIYEYNGTSWVQLGSNIAGETSGDLSGETIGLSGNGDRVIIGARRNDGTSGSTSDNRGHARVFEYSGGSWSQLGSDIDGEAAGDESGGTACHISRGGNVVAIGAFRNTGGGTSAGHVRVYRYNGSSWNQVGSDFDGESYTSAGTSVALADNGMYLAYGAPFKSGLYSYRGQVKVYELGICCDETDTTLTVSACDSFVSPSGKVWTTSNTYIDTITNAGGCDSVLTINLTILQSTTATINPDVCDSYTSPSGKVWTTSGTRNDTIPNAVGCDSVITINLTIRVKKFATINPDVCDWYMSPAGDYYTSSATFNDTITADNGCDSIITVNLTVRHRTTAYHTIIAYDSVRSPSGKYLWTESGSERDTIPNDAGCDSIMRFEVQIIKRIFVDSSMSSSGSGGTWGTAFKTLDEAINAGNDHEGDYVEIWVKGGTYYPGGKGSGNRDSSFVITNPLIRLIGGFSGVETEASQRNPAANPTILCGDIGKQGDSSDNSYHVMVILYGPPVGSPEVEADYYDFSMDGIIIRDGNADGSSRHNYRGTSIWRNQGGGIIMCANSPYMMYLEPTFENCQFVSNYADYGSAMYSKDEDHEYYGWFNRCTFRSNHSMYGTIYDNASGAYSELYIDKCAFDNNTSATSGAALYTYTYNAGEAYPVVRSCVFNNNSAASHGGAVYNNGYVGDVEAYFGNCTFHHNSAGVSGGAIYNFGNSGNCANEVENSIFYRNERNGDASHKFSEFYNSSADNDVYYSSLQRTSSDYSSTTFNSLGYGSNNKFATDPKFEDVNDGDGADGVWRTGDDGLRLSSSSTLINAGDPSTYGWLVDILCSEKVGNRDMGAYEYVSCGPNVKLATEAKIHTASQAVEVEGWVCYCNDSNELLLALDTIGTGAVITPSQVQLQIGNPSTSSYNTSGGLISNPNGGVVLERLWDVSPTTQPTLPVGVRYYYTHDEYQDIVTAMAGLTVPTTISSPSQLQFYKVTGGSTATFPNPHATGVTGIVLSNSTVASTTTWINGTHGVQDHSAEYLVSSFSGGGGGGGAGSAPLPVDMIRFDAKAAANHTAQLDWVTASELNNSHFIIERSYNAIDFEEIGLVQGNGTVSHLSSYAYLDNGIAADQNTVYYRLIQVDYDGTTSTSLIRKVEFSDKLKLSEAQLFPNPTLGKVTVLFNPDLEVESHSVKLIDGVGRVISVVSTDQPQIQIDLSLQPRGFYFVILDSGETFKIIKQ